MSHDALPVPRVPDAVTRSVLAKALWDARRSWLTWALSVAAVGVTYAAFWPSVDTPEMRKAVSSYPKALLEAMNYTDMTTPSGYLGSAVYGLLGPTLVAVFAVAAGARAVAGDEEDGLLDVLLAHPVSRTRVARERFGAIVVEVVVISATLWAAVLVVRGPAHLGSVGAGRLAAGSIHLALFGCAMASVSFCVGAASGRRAWAVAAASAVAVVGYLANGVFPHVAWLEWTRSWSLWHWLLGGAPLRNGLQLFGCCCLLLTIVVLAETGVRLLERRDIRV